MMMKMYREGGREKERERGEGSREKTREERNRESYFTTWGAMTLQGPHHVAKQSSTSSVSLLSSACSQSALLFTHHH